MLPLYCYKISILNTHSPLSKSAGNFVCMLVLLFERLKTVVVGLIMVFILLTSLKNEGYFM